MTAGADLPPDRARETVEVYLYGALRRRFAPRSEFLPFCMEVPVPPGAAVRDVLASLAIGPDEVAHLFLNGECSASSRRVRSGDRLAIFGRDMALLYRQYFPKVEDRA